MNFKSGKGSNDGLFLIVIFILIVLSWISLGVGTKNNTKTTIFPATNTPHLGSNIDISTGAISLDNYSGNSNATIGSTNSVTNKSPYWGKVSIGAGNAASEYQSAYEYITIEDSGLGAPVNISGWSLTNSKGTKTFQVGGNVTRFASDRAIIPYAADVYVPGQSSISVPVILGNWGRVTIISGSQSYVSTHLPSFRENICTGYFANDKNFVSLYPTVSNNCPSPLKENGVLSLENSCYQFVRSMSTCRIPNYVDSVRINRVVQDGYVDGVAGLSQSCISYLKSHYSYPSCVLNHSGDSNFQTNSWRVYLNRAWEMWAQNRETITLFDDQGRTVSQYSY